MSKLYKLVLLLILIALSVIILTANIALQFVYERRKRVLKKHRLKASKRSRHESALPRTKAQDFSDFGERENGYEKDKRGSSSPATKSHKSKQNSPRQRQVSTKDTHPLHPQDIKLRQQYVAPDPSSPMLIGEAHLGLALREIPFENHDTSQYLLDGSGGGSSAFSVAAEKATFKSASTTSRSSSSSLSSMFGGNAIPAQFQYGSIIPHDELQKSSKNNILIHDFDYNDGDDEGNISFARNEGGGGTKRTGVEFVKLENPIMAKNGNIIDQNIKSSQRQHSNNSFLSSVFSFAKQSINTNKRKKNRSSSSSSETNGQTPHLYEKEKHILYHLQKASENGNHYAQNMIANSLASGILPIDNHPSVRQHLNITHDVASDFATNDQLKNAILLWHMSAMEGNIESLMALGYRHFISATSKSKNGQNTLVFDMDLKRAERSHFYKKETLEADMQRYAKKSDNMNGVKTTLQQEAVRHSPHPSDHYGVLGTCESSLVYYEEAVNHIMDELESGPLRGKVTPAQDTHILAEIKQRGSPSALSSHNKPDELNEAVKFMEMRASRNQDPDIVSAYKLAQMHHYGIRGVKQDMKLALKYYEICSTGNSWECSGQAGKFYLFGMGMEGEDRDFKKALNYFKIGMPGGISNCEERLISNRANMQKGIDDDEDGWEEVHQCDHPSINGMGLLYVFGVPDLLKPNLRIATRHFELGHKMGNMDSMYNLALLKLGWMNPFYEDLFNSNQQKKPQHGIASRRGPTTSSFIEATTLLTKSADMGHMQAKHRLGMIYSKGFELANVLSVKPECKKALSIYKDLATKVGTTVTKRMRAAYKQYMAGDYESSLRNYLAAAETGSIEAQVNAAFLLEEVTCLGMNHLQCMKASVRLWRAAARMGHEEATLKVGDFYFYGKLREDVNLDDKKSIAVQREVEFSVSPFPWTRYILYPEDILPSVRKATIKSIRSYLEGDTSTKQRFCINGAYNEENSCINSTKQDRFSKEQREHFKIAAKYYRTAADQMHSARANFNLGFMHEWGLGLSQDFPLAKRHYDLASDAAQITGDGVLANKIALFFMNIHEYMVKNASKWVFDQINRQKLMSSTDAPFIDDTLLSATDMTSAPSTRSEIIMYHILSWESALILIFTVALISLMQYQQNRRRLPARR